jgi:hypothetical protein
MFVPTQLVSKNCMQKEDTNLVERDVPILQMTSEKVHLAFECVRHALVDVNVPLQTVHNAANLSGRTRPVSTSNVCVLASIKSSFVRMPIVHGRLGCTDIQRSNRGWRL